MEGAAYGSPFVVRHIHRKSTRLRLPSVLGSFVAVYGTIGPKTIAPPISTYTLDDNLPINYTSPAAANWTSTQELYKSATLPPGQHTLNVNLISNNTWFSIDFFTYIPTPCAQSSTSSDMSEIHHPTHLAPGVVAAVVVTCIAFFSALFSWVVWKRRKPRVDLRPQAYLVGRPQADSATSRQVRTFVAIGLSC